MPTCRSLEILDPAIGKYLLHITPRESPILDEMEARAQERHFPIVGPLVGRILYQLARLLKARRVLELGSGFGYSACWLALALDQSAEIVLTEFSQTNLQLAEEYLRRGKVPPRVRGFHGDALKILEQLEGEFDIIFNDVDKHQYPEVFRRAAGRVRPGGLLISDNVLWHGRVVSDDPDEDTRAVLEYNRLIFSSPDFFSSIIPVRDGISVSLRRGF